MAPNRNTLPGLLATWVAVITSVWTRVAGDESGIHYGYISEPATLLCPNASSVIAAMLGPTDTLAPITWYKSRHQSSDHIMWDTVAMVTADDDGSARVTYLGDLSNERAYLDSTSGNLRISYLEFRDEASYWCDIAGSYSHFVALSVYVKPSPPSIAGLLEPFMLSLQPNVTCTVEQIKPENATFLWRMDRVSRELHSTTEVTIAEGGVARAVSRLTSSFDVADNGRTLWCVVLPGVDTEEYSTTTSAVIRLTGRPPTGAPTLHANVPLIWIGQETSLYCDIDTLADAGEPQPSRTLWKEDGLVLGQSLGFSMTFVATDVSEDGNYSCQVGNALSPNVTSGTSNGVYITVKAPLQVEEPLTETTRDWVYGRDLSLRCIFSGSDVERIVWHATSLAVNVSLYQTSVSEVPGLYRYGQRQAISSTLHLGRFDDTHCPAGLGEFYCSGHTSHTTLNGPYIGVTRIFPPLWNGPPGLTYHAALNTSVTLSCDLCGNPPPTMYRWGYINGTDLREGISVRAESILISRVQSGDFTVYRCTASAGIVNASFDLRLLERGPPHAVTSVFIGDVGSTSFTVHWRPGYDGGYPNVTFNLRISDVTTGDSRFVHGLEADCDDDVSYDVTALRPGAEYWVHVQAANERPSTEGPNTSNWKKVFVRTKSNTTVYVTNVHVEDDWTASVTWEYLYANERDVTVAPGDIGIRVLYSWDDGPWFESPMNTSLWPLSTEVATISVNSVQHKLQARLLVYEYHRFAHRSDIFEYRHSQHLPDIVLLGTASSIVFCVTCAILFAVCVILKRKALYVSCRCCCTINKIKAAGCNGVGTRKESETPVLTIRPEHESQVYEEIPELTYTDIYLTPITRAAPAYLNLEARLSQISAHETFT